MPKKSITYKEAIRATLCYLGVIYMIESIKELLRGPSNWKTDNRQGDYSYTRQYTDAAPHSLNIPNCRKNNLSIVTGKKKIICCNRRDPTSCLFLRNSDNSHTIENQKLIEQNGNKIYFDEAKAQGVDILLIFYKLAGSFSGIPNELFIDSSKKV